MSTDPNQKNYVTDPYQRYFVFDFYNPAGRPKMEDALLKWATENWLYCSVYEHDLKDLVKALKNKQDQLWEENKRLRKVDIKLLKNSVFREEYTLWIGYQNLRLRKIRKELEIIYEA